MGRNKKLSPEVLYVKCEGSDYSSLLLVMTALLEHSENCS